MPRDSHARKDSVLVVDVGNTALHLGVFVGEEVVEERRMASKQIDEPAISRLMERTDALVISSVVPEAVPLLEQLASGVQERILVVDHTLDLGIELACEEPSQVGSDRLCNAVAACRKYQPPVVVIDFGTAITFDVLREKNRYVGGQILPGGALQAAVLHEKTAKLPMINVAPPKGAVGANTEDAMSSGIFLGIVGAVGVIYNRICEEVGKATAVLTGGEMGLFGPYLTITSVSEPHLTLEGARLIYERNKD